MKTILRKSKRFLKKIFLIFHQTFFTIAGSRVQCNVCRYKANRLASDRWHLFSVCPACGSTVRQRLLWSALTLPHTTRLDAMVKNKDVLHFAPEEGLQKLLKPVAKNYATADFFAEGYSYAHIDHNMDISNLHNVKNESWDCLIACDVLEHVYDHLRAVREIHRVLRKGGYCILTVPQKDNLEKTLEDLSPMDPKAREARFGQWDHLRIYGSDFKEMLSANGFDVTVVDHTSFDEETVKKYVLFPPVLSAHPLATNYRKIFIGKKK